MRYRWLALVLLLLGPGGIAGKEPVPLDFTVRLEVAEQALTPDFCWFHPRAAAIPGAGENGKPAVVMTIQKHLKVSDYYSGLWTMRTNDLGSTWSGPTEIPELGWVRQAGGVVVAVADVTPGWHAPTGRLLAIGCSVRYSPKGKQLSDTKRPSQTAYAVHNPKTGNWSTWHTLEMPTDEKFNFARNGCSQWLVEPDGTVLVPIYFATSAGVPASVTVVRCRFDGEKLSYMEHGTELSLNVVRGLCEPSLVKYGNRYYMTIRNDVKGYVSTSDDGLHFGPIRPWTFDDGQGTWQLQHAAALARPQRRPLPRLRAPRGRQRPHLSSSRPVVPRPGRYAKHSRVIRSTEKVLIPERGAQMGNFGASIISANESWVTVSEYMASDKPHEKGADGSTFVARVIWSKPNHLVEQE